MPKPQKFDYFVIGTGTAGQKVALAAGRAGHSVGITDYRDYGGTCALRGCTPKKILLAAARSMNGVERLRGKGFTGLPGFSWPDLQRHKNERMAKIDPGTRRNLSEAGVTMFDARARFTAPHRLDVGGQEVQADHVIIATGGKPAPLDFPGADLLSTSDDFLDLDELPPSLVIVGGGYIGAEFAHLATVLGSRVTVIASDANPVAKFDRDLNSLLADAARERGMDLHFSCKATRVERTDDGMLAVTAERENGTTFTVRADCAFHAAGRVPNVADLGLEAAGIAYGKRGIAVDDHLCTCVRAHYAIGDCSDNGLDLTPVANHDARVLVANLFEGADRAVDYYPVPTLAFTIPPIASVGMTAEEADASDRDLRINYQVTTDDFHAWHQNAIVEAHKIIIDRETETIVGAHLLGPDADEMINLFALAIYQKVTVAELRDRLWAYPTAGARIGTMVK